MIRCRDVATLLSTDQLRAEPLRRRLAVRMHLAMCRHCRRFVRQIALLKDGAGRVATAFDAEIGRDFTDRIQQKVTH
jgi:predicted anti-sigma-YlaC factor YlaD